MCLGTKSVFVSHSLTDNYWFFLTPILFCLSSIVFFFEAIFTDHTLVLLSRNSNSLLKESIFLSFIIHSYVYTLIVSLIKASIFNCAGILKLVLLHANVPRRSQSESCNWIKKFISSSLLNNSQYNLTLVQLTSRELTDKKINIISRVWLHLKPDISPSC